MFLFVSEILMNITTQVEAAASSRIHKMAGPIQGFMHTVHTCYNAMFGVLWNVPS